MLDSVVSRTRIFDNGKTTITLAGPKDADHVVITFTSLGENDPAQRGFAEEFLLKCGYRVVAVQKYIENWFQDISEADLRLILGPIVKDHKFRTIYGLSMGGYAALYFANCLNARPLALSPRFVLDPRYTTPDLSRYARTVAITHKSMADVADSTANPVVVLDPLITQETAFLQNELVEAFPSMTVYRLPFAGHPCAQALMDMGFLKEIVVKTIERADIPPSGVIVTKGRKRSSAAILSGMARWAYRSRRIELSLRLSNLAMSVDGNRETVLYDLGTTLLAMGNIEEAERATLRGLEINPNSVGLHRRIADIYRRQGRYSEALRVVNEILAMDPSDLVTARIKRNVLIETDEFDNAIKIAQNIIDQDNTYSVHDYEQLVRALMSSGRHADAVEKLRVMIANDPRSLDLRRLRNCLEVLGRIDEAIRIAIKVVDYDPNNISEIASLASLYAKNNKWTESVEVLCMGISIEPQNSLLLRRKRDYLEKSGNISGAAEAGIAVLQANPSNRADLAHLVSLILRIEDIDEAKLLILRALEAEPKSAELRRGLLSLHQKSKNWSAVIETSDELLSTIPDDVKTQRIQREALYELGKYSEAIYVSRKIIRHSQTYSVDDHEHLVRGFMALGDHENAIQTLREMIPASRRAVDFKRLRNCLEAMGQTEEALSAAITAVSLDPDSAPDIAHVAHLYAELNNWSTALCWLDRAIQISPENLILLRRRRNYLEKSGKILQAVAAARKVLLLDDATKSDRSHLRSLIKRSFFLRLGRLIRLRNLLGLYMGVNYVQFVSYVLDVAVADLI